MDFNSVRELSIVVLYFCELSTSRAIYSEPRLLESTQHDQHDQHDKSCCGVAFCGTFLKLTLELELKLE